jgi:Mrp family chromosome partitioning ATPase
MTTETWDYLQPFEVDARHLKAHKLITAHRDDPAYAAFDVLRTRIMQALRENGWKRVAITSPTPGCGKTFTSVNLAITLSRYDNIRTVLFDMDMRRSNVHRVLGVEKPGSMGDFLRGLKSVEEHFKLPGRNSLNIGQTLAVGMNARREEFASELMQDPLTEEILEEVEDELEPDIMLFDMPPVLNNDDVIAMRPLVDAFLLVAGGGITTAQQLKLVERNIGKDKPILGVVLNKAEGPTLTDSYY